MFLNVSKIRNFRSSSVPAQGQSQSSEENEETNTSPKKQQNGGKKEKSESDDDIPISVRRNSTPKKKYINGKGVKNKPYVKGDFSKDNFHFIFYQISIFS